jgi:hypothetical protein
MGKSLPWNVSVRRRFVGIRTNVFLCMLEVYDEWLAGSFDFPLTIYIILMSMALTLPFL